MPAIIYARFSPRKNAAECESIQTQLEYCRGYARQHGLEVKGEYSDEALSGDEEDRPGLWAAVDALGKDDVLLCYKLDRLARNVYLAVCIEKAVRERKARIISANGEGTWEDTNESKMIRGILQVLAEYESKVIAARTKAAMLRHQAAGRSMSSKAPFGYRIYHGRLVEDEYEQLVVQRIMELSDEGHGTWHIAVALKREGILRRGKSGWYHRIIAGVIRRETQRREREKATV